MSGIKLKTIAGGSVTLTADQTISEDIDFDITKYGKVNTIASYILDGIASFNTISTKSNSTTLSTGNGTTQAINTNISSVDFTTPSNGSGYFLSRQTTGLIVLPDAFTEYDTFVQPSAATSSDVYVSNTSKFSVGDRVHVYNKASGNAAIVTGTVASIGAGLITLDKSFSRTAVSYGIYLGSTPTTIKVNTSKVRVKSRSTSGNHVVSDGLRGVGKSLYTNLSSAEAVTPNKITAFGSNSFTVGSDSDVNGNTTTFVDSQELFTHVKWGYTDGSFWVEAYNPITLQGMRIREGINVTVNMPHSLGSITAYNETKRLNSTDTGVVYYGDKDSRMLLYSATGSNASNLTGQWGNTAPTDDTFTMAGNDSTLNQSGGVYVDYYFANSKYKKLVNYIGTGIAGNEVDVGFMPSRIILKRIDSIGDYAVYDNKRITKEFYLNLSGIEITNDVIDITPQGFIIKDIASARNASGGQYIAIVEADTNADGGDTFFEAPVADAKVAVDGYNRYVTGKDEAGYTFNFDQVQENIDSSNTNGLKWIGRNTNGTYRFEDNKPINSVSTIADTITFNTDTGKMFYGITEVPAISFIKSPIRFDADIPQYIDLSQAISENIIGDTTFTGKVDLGDNVSGKNQCTAWVNFDGTTTPPTIKDSFNVRDVVRTATGNFKIVDTGGNTTRSVISSLKLAAVSGIDIQEVNSNDVQIGYLNNSGAYFNPLIATVQIFGGKN